MPADVEARLVDQMRPLFGEFAVTALAQQKEKLGLGESPGREEYLRLVDALKAMCDQVAGPAVAAKVYDGLIRIVQEGA